MAKKLNVNEIVREYLLFKSIFASEKIKKYKEELKRNGNEAKHNLISYYENFIYNMGRIQVPSLVDAKKTVSLDVYLNDLNKTFESKTGDKLRPERYVEFTNQVQKMISLVPGAEEALLSAFENSNYSEIARRFKLDVGKAGGKQIFSVANEILTVAGMSGKNTHISSLENEIKNYKNALEKAKKEGKSTADLIGIISRLEAEVKESNLNQAYLMRSIASSDGKRAKRIELSLTGISDTVKDNNSMLKQLLRFKPAKAVLVLFLTLLAGSGIGWVANDLVNNEVPPIVENGDMHKEILAKFGTALADGKMSEEEITDLTQTIVKIGNKDVQAQYKGILDEVVESTKLQGIKTNIVELAKAFGVAEEEGLSDAELEAKIVNDEAFRATVIAKVAKFAKYADYDELNNIVTAVGDKLGIEQKAENESNKDFKNRVLDAIDGLQTENTELSAKYWEVKGENITLEIALKDNTTEIAGLKSAIDNLNSTIDSLKAQIETLTNASGDAETIKLLQSQLAEAQAGKAIAEKALAEKTAEFEIRAKELEESISKLEQQIEEKDAKINELESKVTALEEQLENAYSKEEVDQLNAKIAELNAKIIKLETENAELDEAVNVSEKALKEAKAKIAELVSQNTEKNAKIAELESKVTALEEQLKNASSDEEVKQLNSEIAELKNEISELKKENAGLKEQIADLKSALEEAQENANSLAEQLASITTERDLYKTNWEEVSKNYEQLQDDYATLTALYNQKVDEIKALKEKYNGAATAEEKQALVRQIAKLEADLAEANVALDELEGTAKYLIDNLNKFASKFGISGLSPEEILNAILAEFGITPSVPNTNENGDEIQLG